MLVTSWGHLEPLCPRDQTSILSDELSSSVMQADHAVTATSADAQLIVTPPTTINKIYKIIRAHTCHSLSHRHALSQP